MLSHFAVDQLRLLSVDHVPSIYSRCVVRQRVVAYAVTWLYSHLPIISYYISLPLISLPSVTLIAISGGVVISVQIQWYLKRFCLHLSGSDSVHLWVYGGTQLQFYFPDCPSLSILRSQWHHVDRATNPENMSKLAVNKERASLRVDRACCLLLYLSVS